MLSCGSRTIDITDYNKHLWLFVQNPILLTQPSGLTEKRRFVIALIALKNSTNLPITEFNLIL